MVFLIDLPRLENLASPNASAAGSHVPIKFYTELVYFLQATGVGEKMVASLANYDFSRTADIAFVHTMYVSPPFAICCCFGNLLQEKEKEEREESANKSTRKQKKKQKRDPLRLTDMD